MLAIVRILIVLSVLAILGYGSMLALALMVEPEKREFSSIVPPSKFNK